MSSTAIFLPVSTDPGLHCVDALSHSRVGYYDQAYTMYNATEPAHGQASNLIAFDEGLQQAKSPIDEIKPRVAD